MMKNLNIISRSLMASLLLIVIMTGCKKPGDLTIDPVEYDTLFTFSPSHGFPGSTVQITGDNLSGVTQIAFGSIEGDITSQTATAISAVIPVGAQTAKIKLVKAGLIMTSLKNFIVDPTPIPTVIDFTPAVAGSGDIITITGNLLDKVDSVFIGTMKAVISGTPTASSMQIIAPVGLKTAKIRLFYTYLTSYGMLKPAESESDKELSLALPVISSIEPNITVLNIGDSVTINGTMMGEVTKVEFGSINATPFVHYGDTMLSCHVPAGATTGKIKLTHLDGFTESGTFQVNLPVIISITPDKGAENGGITRAFSLSGTKLGLVNTVLVGTTTATIQTQTASLLIFTVSGNKAGLISLVTTNGTVKSSVPFFFTGNMWLADYDNIYTPVRLFNEPMYTGAANSESWADITVNSKTIVNGGAPYNNYRQWNVTFTGNNSPRLYFRGDQGGSANPVPDRFLLYTPNSQGVTFEFDISWDAIPDTLVDANGKVDLKINFFNADQGAGGGYAFYTEHIYVPYAGPGVWQHVSVDTYLTRVNTGDYMYNRLIPPVTTKKFSPNNMRIIAIMFPEAYAYPTNPATPNTAVQGQSMTVNFDNVKFVIN